MYAVLGITGKVGGAVAETLLANGEQVRGVARDPEKASAWKSKGADIVAADYDDRLVETLREVDGAFIMIPPDLLPSPGFPESTARVKAIRKAVLAAQPPKLIFLSSWGSEQPSKLGIVTPNRILEQELAKTGIPSTFLRPTWFMENVEYALVAARSTGNYYSFYHPLDRPYEMVATKDVGRIAAEALLESWIGNRVVEISGPAQHSSLDVAAALGHALDKPIEPVAVPRESWVEVLAQNGMPADMSGAYIELVDSLNSGWIHLGVSGTKLIRGTTNLSTTIRAIVAKTS